MQITLLDGGLGQEIYRRSKLTEALLWSVEAMLNEPEIVREVHLEFIVAGAEICTLNTYAATPTRLRNSNREDDFELIHSMADQAVREAIQNSKLPIKVAGCLPPLHGSYLGTPSRPKSSMVEEYAQIVQLHPAVDLWIIETMTNPLEAEAAVTAGLESGKPVFLAYRLEKNGKLKSGQTLKEVKGCFDHKDLSGILINCSEPEIISDHIAELSIFDMPFGAYGNGFVSVEPLARGESVFKLQAREDLSPTKYADYVDQWISVGATIVGGCCEISPSHIREIKRRL